MTRKFQTTLRIAALILILAAAGPALFADSSSAASADTSAFEKLLMHYEQVRTSLIADSTEGVAQHGAEMLTLLGSLEKDFTPRRAGVDASGLEGTRELLPLLKGAAQSLASATSIEDARDAFYDLSKPLVRWRKAATMGEKPIVAYCSMARRSWLQPAGQLENPYHGQSMLHCGETVDG